MQGQVAELCLLLDGLAVHADRVGIEVGLRSELADHDAVDADASRLHQLLGLAPRRDSGARNDFLQSFGHDRK